MDIIIKMKVKIKRFSSHARILQKTVIGSACYDLFAARCAVLETNATRSVEKYTPGWVYQFALYIHVGVEA